MTTILLFSRANGSRLLYSTKGRYNNEMLLNQSQATSTFGLAFPQNLQCLSMTSLTVFEIVT